MTKEWIKTVINELKEYGEIFEKEHQYTEDNNLTITENIKKSHDGTIIHYGTSYDLNEKNEYSWNGILAKDIETLLDMSVEEIERIMGEIYFYGYTE